MWLPNRSDTNQAVQSEAGWTFEILDFKKKRKCTIRVAKTKALISFVVAAKLICVFVYAYADCWFSHRAAHMRLQLKPTFRKNTKLYGILNVVFGQCASIFIITAL